MIRFNCPICHQTFTAEESQTGQQFDCDCGQKLEVPQGEQSEARRGGRRRDTDTFESVHGDKSVPRGRYDYEDDRPRRKRYDDDDHDRPRRPRRRDYEDDYDDDDYDHGGRRHGLSRRTLQDASSKKLASGLCGILLGSLGIHKFILGYTTPGIIMLVVTLCSVALSPLTFGLTSLGLVVIQIIGLVEGILYLSKTDEDFYYTYVRNKKEWF